MAGNMTDMMLTPAEIKKDMGSPTASTDDQERYPYGLRINLGQDEIEKLKISKLPSVGDPFTIEAVGYVCDVSQSETEGNGKRSSLCIQITDMELDEGVEPDDDEQQESKADRLYPADKQA